MSKKTNGKDMKRVLVEVQANEHNIRAAKQMDEAVNKLLAPGYYAALYSMGHAEQSIRARDGRVAAESAPCRWLPDEPGNCPPQFVLCAPRELFRPDVPDYTGPIK